MCICICKIAGLDYDRSGLVSSYQLNEIRCGRHQFVGKYALGVDRGVRVQRYWQNNCGVVYLVDFIRDGCCAD